MTVIPAISVAITLYNKGAFIVEAVESVRSQTFQNFEIVVVDDGSTDDGPTRLLQIEDPRIRVIKQANAGVSAARTRAMSEPRGKYVAFLDADDVWQPDHLIHLLKLSTLFQDASLYGNKFVERSSIKDINESSGNVQYRIVDDYFLECAIGRSPLYTSSCMVPRERALQLGGFPTGDVCGEDLALWIKLASTGAVAVSNYVGCVYRRGIDSLSRQSSYRNATDVSMNALNDLLEQHADWPNRRKQNIREYFYRLALAHCLDGLRAGELDQAKYYLRLSGDTRYLRRRLWEARLLAYAPRELRNLFFRLAENRRASA
jgi:glycosyltransferase involved in cell wall biosynthesis